MRVNSSVFALATLIIFSYMQGVSADIIPPGGKPVNYCFLVENTGDYPDYVFLLVTEVGNNINSYGMIEEGSCTSFYTLATPAIYAVSREDFNQTEIEGLEAGHGLTLSYFESPAYLKSDIAFHGLKTIDENDPAESITDVFTIASFEGGILDISKSRVIYGFEDGTTEEVPYAGDERPAHTRQFMQESSDFGYLYFLVPALALVGIVLILVKRK